MAATASGTTNLSTNRDAIITRALRIVGAYGQGETPSANAITEGAEALNALVKTMQTDGMPLWKISQFTTAYTSTTDYTIGIGQTVNKVAPLKIFQAFNRDTSVTPNTDSPILIVPYQDYLFVGTKQQTGTPQQLFYKPPGEGGTIPNTDMVGYITVYPKPDSNAISNKTLVMIGQLPFENFDILTDIPDFPSYWFNAIVWLLASDLAYEYGVGLAERAMIAKKGAEYHQAALSFGSEETSIFLRPTVQYYGPGGSSY